MDQSFETLTKQLKNSKNDPIRSQLETSLKDYKNKLKNLVCKEIVENIKKKCYCFLHVMRTIQQI
jgi:hypothetical protein